jgi:hypothetical protein
MATVPLDADEAAKSILNGGSIAATALVGATIGSGVPCAEVDVDGETLRLLADGRLREVTARLDALRTTDPLVADVVAADAAARAATIGLGELRDLERRLEAEAPDRPLLRWWVVALLGERAFLDADLGAIPLAIGALAEMPTEPYAGATLLYVRGRLRRIASALYLLAPSPENLADHRRLRDAAVADLLRADLTAEVATTRGLSAALHALATWEDVLEDLEVLRDARALLGDIEGSVWAPLLDHLTGAVALAAGDLATADAAIAAVERQRHLHPVFAALADMGRAEHRLFTDGGSAASAAALVEALDRMRRDHPHLLALSQLRAANVLADYGHTAEARTVGLAALGWPPTNAVIRAAGELLRVRLDVLEGAARPREDADALLAEMEALGHPRRAGATALRLARDHARLGDQATADRLRAWGLDRMPAPRRRTAWEQWWAAGPEAVVAPGAPPTAAVSGVSAAPAVSVRVLAPALELAVGGEPARLREMPAKLLLGLLVTHPEPLHVERAVDLLWPDAPLGVGRDRLNTVAHRLRTALAVPGRPVRRAGDLLILDPAGWDVDLFTLRRALRGGDGPDPDAARRAAIGAATGCLCHAQFPYDDLLIDARRALAAEVGRALASLGEGPADSSGGLADAAHAFAAHAG